MLLPKYSVKDYLNAIVQNKDKKKSMERLQTFASAILNYGAKGHSYIFGYKTDSLVNSALPDAEIKSGFYFEVQDIKESYNQ